MGKYSHTNQLYLMIFCCKALSFPKKIFYALFFEFPGFCYYPMLESEKPMIQYFLFLIKFQEYKFLN